MLNTQLAKTEYLAGDYSIADMANWAWVRSYRWSGIEIDGLEHLQRWHNAIKVRPAAEKGITVPVDMRLLRDGKEDSKETQDFIKGAQTMVQELRRTDAVFRVITCNTNGIRAAQRKGFFEWLAKQNADVVCIQETKAQEHQLVDDAFDPRVSTATTTTRRKRLQRYRAVCKQNLLESRRKLAGSLSTLKVAI